MQPGRVGAGVEVEDDRLAAQVGERHLLAVLVEQREVGCLVASLEHLGQPSSNRQLSRPDSGWSSLAGDDMIRKRTAPNVVAPIVAVAVTARSVGTPGRSCAPGARAASGRANAAKSRATVSTRLEQTGPQDAIWRAANAEPDDEGTDQAKLSGSALCTTSAAGRASSSRTTSDGRSPPHGPTSVPTTSASTPQRLPTAAGSLGRSAAPYDCSIDSVGNPTAVSTAGSPGGSREFKGGIGQLHECLDFHGTATTP